MKMLLPFFSSHNAVGDGRGLKTSSLFVKDTASKAVGLREILSAVGENDVHSVANKDLKSFIRSRIQSEGLTHSFFVIDLTKVQKLYENWRRLLPRVEVFYAVKCNPDDAIVRLLASLGSSFDCASQWEVELVMNAGVEASRIIFANPCKRPDETAETRRLGVQLTTFDSSYELEKMRDNAPDVKALLRIRADDPTAVFPLGCKFGAEMGEVPGLFAKAKALGVDIAGVCFHIGSGANDPNAFSAAIALARKVFDMGLQQGFDMSILDIGGGFSSRDLTKFESMTRAVNASLDRHFPTESGVRIFGEPGRYIVDTCATVASNIFGIRERTVGGALKREYWITDGVHGSFSPLSVGLTKLAAHPLRIHQGNGDRMISSTVFGPTLNGHDHVLKDVDLPDLSVGDWILFPNMGAYTSVLSCNFSGMHSRTGKIYVRT